MDSKTLLIFQPVEKKPKDYEKIRNPQFIHPFNHSINLVLRVSVAVVAALEAGQARAWEDLAEQLSERGLASGTYQVRLCMGGPGRRRRFSDSSEWWQACQGKGMPSLGTVNVP